MYRNIYALLIIAIFAIGCSGKGMTPASPDLASPDSPERHHALWGFWQGVIDPQAETVEFVPLRTSELHLNALPFLEPPPYLNLTIENLAFDGDIIDVDIGLRHPFLGLVQFTGFDVCGIFITNGSVGGFTDSALMMAGEGDTRLLNADGYSRWWNPAEFPNTGKIFGYTDGLLGAPDSVADYNSTLNGYKYFCDDLDDPNDPLSDVGTDSRGMFSAGQKNVRHYTIQMEAGLIFNYAIDASWKKPVGVPPYTAPDDFSEAANRAEAWRITVTETENSLWNDGADNGGDLSLSIDVYDWFNADMNTVRVESPGNFVMAESSTTIGGGEGYSTYEIDITSATPGENEIDILVSVISEEEDFEGFLPGVNTTSYFTHTAPVSPEEPTGLVLQIDMAKTFDTEFRDYAPAIETNWDDEVYLMWFAIYYVPNNTTTDYARSDDSGVSWEEPTWTALGGYVDADDPTGAIDGVGDMYYYGCSHNTITWTCIVRFNNWDFTDSGEWSGLFQVGSNYGRAFEFTHDGLPLCLGDLGDAINYKLGSMPNWPWATNVGWPGGWSDLDPVAIVPTPARLSKTDNMVRDSLNRLHFVYFSSNATDTWIRIAHNADGTGTVWSIDNDIYDGTVDGYDSCRDPGLDLDDGVFRSGFIGHKSSPSDIEQILSTRSTDGDAWDAPIVVYETAGSGLLRDVTIEKVTVSDTDILALSFLEDDEVYFTYSFDNGQTWDTPTMLSAGTGAADKPDMCVTPDGYIHNTWEVGYNPSDEYTGSIEYIRAGFVEE